MGGRPLNEVLDAMRTLAALLIYLVAINASHACSPAPVRYWDREAQSPGDELRRIPSPPRLIATSELLHRPAIRTGTSTGCDQWARFVIRVHLERGSPARLSDYGYVFRVRSKNAPSTYFTGYPLQANIANGTAEFEVEVWDTGIGQRSAIDLDVEVRAADRALRLGPKARFRLQAEPSSRSDGV
jgi:hypothetical protein